MNYGWILFGLGMALAIFSHPKIRAPIMARLFNEGIIISQSAKPEKAEVIKYAGPNLSIFAIGFILMVIGIVLLNS